MNRFFAKIECPTGAYQVLVTGFHGRKHFHIQSKAEPMIHYMIFGNEYDLDILAYFAKRNHFLFDRITFDELKALQVNTADYEVDGDSTLAVGVLAA